MANFNPILFLYQFLEKIIIWLFSPLPPKPSAKLNGPRVAIIGAGLTGISSAAHCVSHGCDVVIFEQGDKEHVGGIWAKVNHTSGLQIHSIMYRFHPSVSFDTPYPKRDAIVGQIRKVWEDYGLVEKTRFDTKVESVKKVGDKWVINDGGEGEFDGIITAVGTCGAPKMPHMDGMNKFEGKVVHSSQLDGVDVKGKNIAIIGGGASAVEALEYAAAKGARKINILSRSDKWIIPRNPVVDALLSLNVFGRETMCSWIPETLLRKFFYRDLQDLAPPTGQGLFTSTPMVNDQVLDQIRDGTAVWDRGDILDFNPASIQFNKRQQGVPKNSVGQHITIPTDIMIQATGFQRPSINFLPSECFDEPYPPPNWYLQTFPVEHMSICATNSTYVNAIGTVGHFHIGVYTRILLMFLMDPLTRPPNSAMKLWVRFTKWMKRTGPTKAFDFFSYGELIYWYLFICLINPFRWKWALWVLFGWRRPLTGAQWVVNHEKKLWGYDNIKRGPL